MGVLRELRGFVAKTYEPEGSSTGQRSGRASEVRHARAERRETRVVGLPLLVAVENLLNHDGDLEEREGFVEADRRDVTPGPRGVALDDLVPARPPRAIGDDR